MVNDFLERLARFASHKYFAAVLHAQFMENF